MAAACADLEKAGLPATLMVDCSHANSHKQHERQKDVAADIAQQIESGSRQVFGVMLESHLVAGAQKFNAGQDDVRHWSTAKASPMPAWAGADTVTVLEQLSQAVQTRREHAHVPEAALLD